MKMLHKGRGLPNLQPYVLRDVFHARDRVVAVMEEYLDVLLDGESLRELAAGVAEKLPGKIPEEVVFDSIRHLGGTKLTNRRLRIESWRLAGNNRLLRNGKPVLPWSRQQRREWVPAQVVDSRLLRTKRNKVGAVFKLRILAGTSATLLTEVFWTMRFARFLSTHIGFSPPWGKLELARLEQIVGLRLYLLIEPGCSEGDSPKPKFEHVTSTGATTKYNKQILSNRARIGFRCPQGYKHQCYDCHVGYHDCPLATHPRTFVKELCSICENDAWFDPDFVAIGVCVACQRRAALKGNM